jgi:hypothetical protein
MNIPDVNVLLAGSRADHPHFEQASAWLQTELSSEAARPGIEILPIVASGFLRLATHPKVFREPTPLERAAAFLTGLLSHPSVEVRSIGRDEWHACQQLCLDKQLTGNDVSDAFIAAVAHAAGRRVVTFDRGFLELLPKRAVLLLRAPPQGTR